MDFNTQNLIILQLLFLNFYATLEQTPLNGSLSLHGITTQVFIYWFFYKNWMTTEQ